MEYKLGSYYSYCSYKKLLQMTKLIMTVSLQYVTKCPLYALTNEKNTYTTLKALNISSYF